MREQDKQMYRDMPARVFIRAVRDPEMGAEEYELSEGEATDLLLLRELDAALRGKDLAVAEKVSALRDEELTELRMQLHRVEADEGFTGRDLGSADVHLQIARLLIIKLREALQPFAECASQIPADESNEEWAKFRLLVKDFRRAAHVMGAT
ncbi:MAG: hypothetical protein ABL932_15100 [Terricaulis sp.]